jgi:hypothetical protein
VVFHSISLSSSSDSGSSLDSITSRGFMSGFHDVVS